MLSTIKTLITILTAQSFVMPIISQDFSLFTKGILMSFHRVARAAHMHTQSSYKSYLLINANITNSKMKDVFSLVIGWPSNCLLCGMS